MKSIAKEVLEKVSKQIDYIDDEFDITGKNIATKTKSLSPETAIITEKLLSDILFQVQIGNVITYLRLFYKILAHKIFIILYQIPRHKIPQTNITSHLVMIYNIPIHK